MKTHTAYKGQSWGFTSRSSAKAILSQVLSIVTWGGGGGGGRTHTEVTACD